MIMWYLHSNIVSLLHTAGYVIYMSIFIYVAFEPQKFKNLTYLSISSTVIMMFSLESDNRFVIIMNSICETLLLDY